MASRPFGALAILLVAFAAAPQAAADDPVGAARARLDASTRGPFIDSSPMAGTEFYFHGPHTNADYPWLRTPTTGLELAYYDLLVRGATGPLLPPPMSLQVRDRLIPLDLDPPYRTDLPPRAMPRLEGCTPAWYASSACLLRLYP